MKITNLVVLYWWEVGKVIQIPQNSGDSFAEKVIPEICQIQNSTFSRISILLTYREAMNLFWTWDLILLYRALRILDLHKKTCLWINFQEVDQSDTIQIITLLLKLKILWFRYYGDNDLWTDIIRSIDNNVPLIEDAKRMLLDLERQDIFSESLKGL